MSARIEMRKVEAKEDYIIFTCDDCGAKFERPAQGIIPSESHGWVVVEPLDYGCDAKYYQHYCPACARKRGHLVGNLHPNWK